MTTSPDTDTAADEAELELLWRRYQALWRHVNADHAIPAEGNANQLEAVHLAAHRAEGSAWHDAWRLPSTAPDDQQQQEERR